MAKKPSKGASSGALVAFRIPFAEAVAEEALLRRHFEKLSLGQRAHLKTLYGAELDRSTFDRFGFSEYDYFCAGQGGAEFDDLGYIRSIREKVPYVSQEYREGWIVGGRRLGKTDAFASTIVAYEAALGGHEQNVRRGQQAVIFEIAQDLRMARYSLHFIRATLESSPLLSKEIVAVTADRIDLRNGVSIACVPPTLKSVRGFASPVAVLDEVGVWYQDSDSANPDYEIYRAVLPGQLQFDHPKIVGISSPWNKSGLLFQYFEAGTNGSKLHSSLPKEQFKNVLVVHSPTAAIGDVPQVGFNDLEAARARDVNAFNREFKAEFQDSISGFLPPELVDAARRGAPTERAPDPSCRYVAAIDPAFKRDAFALTIVHKDASGRIVQDAVRRFVRLPGAPPLNPQAILDQIVPLMRSYAVRFCHSDQYQLESFSQLARMSGMEIVEDIFTAKRKAELYGNLQQLFFQQRISLLDDFQTAKELKSLERELTGGGNVVIGAPPGMHDDMATVLAIASSHAMHIGPREKAASAPAEPSIHERIMQQVARKNLPQRSGWEWD